MADWSHPIKGAPRARGDSAGPMEQYESTVEGHEVQYPYNNVVKYESGHTVEYNNTAGSEYIRIAHKLGSEIIFDKDGGITIRAAGSRQNPSHMSNPNERKTPADVKIEMSGNCNIVMEQGGTISSRGDLKFDVGGDMEFNVGGELTYNLNNEIRMNAHVVIESLEAQATTDLGDVDLSVYDDIEDGIWGAVEGGGSI